MAKITRSINVTVVEARAESGEVQTHEFYGSIPNKKEIGRTFDAIFRDILDHPVKYTTTMRLETRKYEMSLDEFMTFAHVVNEEAEA